MKRHTAQDHKQALGQYYTTNSDQVLAGFEHLVKDKFVVDPFAGGCDLLRWAVRHGCRGTLGLDLEPTSTSILQNNSIENPPDYSGKLVLTNPPYLSRNKYKGDKSVFDQWGFDNLYKCHLASLRTADEFIEIVPVNFFCESRDAIRRYLFATHSITQATFWTDPSFDDTNQCVTVFHAVKKKQENQQFSLTFRPEGRIIDVLLEERYRYLHGADFFEYISTGDSVDLAITKTDTGMPEPNSRIVIGLLDKGSWRSGFSYNEGEAVYCKPASFTTYQLTLSREFTEAQQRAIVDLAQTRLEQYRAQYSDMFLANYMGEYQKILSRDYLNRLLRASVRELGLDKIETELFIW